MKTSAIILASKKGLIQSVVAYTPKILAPSLFKAITANPVPVKVIATQVALKSATTSNIIASGTSKAGFAKGLASLLKIPTIIIGICSYLYQWFKNKIQQALITSINYFPFLSFWFLAKKAYIYKFKMFNPYRFKRIIVISYLWTISFIPLYAAYRIICSEYLFKELYKNKQKPELQ